jgi:F-type H+-transporting ATPase subunit b
MMSLSRIFSGMLLLAPAMAQAGIPQLEQTEWFASQLFWLAIAFFLTILLVRLFIAPTIGNVLQARETAIREAATDAERARLAAEHAQDSSGDAMRDARERSTQLTATAKQQVDERANKKNKELDAEIALQLKGAEKDIQAAKADAMKSLEAEADDIAKAIHSTLMDGQSVSSLKAVS